MATRTTGKRKAPNKLPQKWTRNRVKRDPAGRFLKGSVANPGGRPIHRPLSEAIRKVLEQGEKVDVLAQRLISQACKGNVPAARLVAEYSEGKPVQQLELHGLEHSDEWLIVKQLVIAVLEKDPAMLEDFTTRLEKLIAKEENENG